MNLRFIHALTALTLYSCELCCIVLGETQPVGIDDLNPLVVTPEGGFSQPLVTSAWAISYSETDSKKLMSRSLAESLSGIPSVMIQKTASWPVFSIHSRIDGLSQSSIGGRNSIKPFRHAFGTKSILEHG